MPELSQLNETIRKSASSSSRQQLASSGKLLLRGGIIREIAKEFLDTSDIRIFGKANVSQTKTIGPLKGKTEPVVCELSDELLQNRRQPSFLLIGHGDYLDPAGAGRNTDLRDVIIVPGLITITSNVSLLTWGTTPFSRCEQSDLWSNVEFGAEQYFKQYSSSVPSSSKKLLNIQELESNLKDGLASTYAFIYLTNLSTERTGFAKRTTNGDIVMMFSQGWTRGSNLLPDAAKQPQGLGIPGITTDTNSVFEDANRWVNDQLKRIRHVSSRLFQNMSSSETIKIVIISNPEDALNKNDST